MKILAVWLSCLLLASGALSARPVTVYIGTYTGTGSQGIYRLLFDPANGAMSPPELAARIPNPSFLAFGPEQRNLYAVDENGGGVNAFTVEAGSGRLNFINRQATGGTSTAHLVVADRGRLVIAANYGSGTICAFPVRTDGSLGPRSAFLEQHGPLGPNPHRQTMAHPHSITLAPDGRLAFVCDLGLDRVFAYRLDRARPLVPVDPPTAVPPGVGPRHSVFSADGRFFYVVNEMGGSICAFRYEASTARLTLRQTISTLPPDFQGENGSAEIQVHPNGRFLYASNRGPDSLAVFARDSADGTLAPVEIVPCGGRFPRSFALSPDGRWLLCAGQKSDTLTVFSVDATTGRLTPTGTSVSVGQPVCVLFTSPTGAFLPTSSE